ncbi:proteinase-activated receptor 1 isoform X2 [Syngnathoides biaculeatus]|uniref:proteinase-activated receptor 1 isoform X2 n=1 Tax=Syngnathoides biaculeatus TaxID=300417 RepID=UPI002ADD98DB|nr:proteinase-activated receptor 1 isoform X2 [Syngnathoides biaculeatus]
MLPGRTASAQTSLWLLVVFSLHSSALSTRNASGLSPRTFSGHAEDDAAVSELDSLSDVAGSGSQPEPVRRHRGSPRRHPPGRYLISEEAKRFLRSWLTTTFVPTVYTAVFAVSVPLNLVAAVMFVHPVRPRKPAVIYMLNLACADLLFGLLLPFKIAYHYQGNNWSYGPFMCRVATAAFYCNMYCSVLLMACIGTDRFLAVVYPMNSLTWRSRRTAWAVCAAMWLLALAGAGPLLASGQTAYLPQLDITTCHDVQDSEKLKSYYRYFFPAYCSVFFFIPLVLTAGAYVRIIQALAAANVENRSKKTRAVVMAALVLAVFVVCFAPANVILMLHYVEVHHKSADASYRAYLLATCAGSLSCCLDPLLYYFGSSRCRKRVLALLGCRRADRRPSSSRTQTSRISERRDGQESGKMEVVQSGSGTQYLTAIRQQRSLCCSRRPTLPSSFAEEAVVYCKIHGSGGCRCCV